MVYVFGNDSARPVKSAEIIKPCANAIQIGGDHYKATDELLERSLSVGLNKVPEPWDIAYIRGYNNIQSFIFKYIDRYDKKNGIQDLKKAKHCIEKLIEIEEEKERIRGKSAK